MGSACIIEAPISPDHPSGVIKVEENLEMRMDDKGEDCCRDYLGASVGTSCYIRDEFKSKYTHEKMHKWREAEIVKVFKPNSIRIHFAGWKDVHDIQLDVSKAEDRARIAPLKLISSDHRSSGRELSPGQIIASLEFLLTGEGPSQSGKCT